MIQMAVTEDQGVGRCQIDLQQFQVGVQRIAGIAEIQQIPLRLGSLGRGQVQLSPHSPCSVRPLKDAADGYIRHMNDGGASTRSTFTSGVPAPEMKGSCAPSSSTCIVSLSTTGGAIRISAAVAGSATP